MCHHNGVLSTLVLFLLLMRMVGAYQSKQTCAQVMKLPLSFQKFHLSHCSPCNNMRHVNVSSNFSSSRSFSSQGTSSFTNKLGCPKYISAPMVDQSYLPWRYMVRKHGTDLSFTQMINAKVFLKSSTYQREVVDWLDYPDGQHSTALGDFCKSWDRPLIVQLAGDDPETLLSVAKMIVMHGEISAIDLNLGCPQNIAKRGHYGAYLLPDTDLVLKILSTLSEKVDCPITAKIRKLPKDEDTIALVQSIEQCGVQMVTVHGRYPSQRKQYTGTADWDIIKNVKESVNIPIVANGGISSLYDAKRCLEYTRADAVMSSEALLENPRLFSEKGSHDFEHDFVRSQLENARELVHYFQIFPQRRSSTSSLRAHLFKMLHRFLSSPIHHDLRFSLTKCSIDEMMDMVCELHKRLERVNFQTENALKQGLLVSSSWYSRHRNHSDQRLCNKNDE